MRPGSLRGYLCQTNALHEQTARFANGFRACHPVRAEVASLAESATSATFATENENARGERRSSWHAIESRSPGPVLAFVLSPEG